MAFIIFMIRKRKEKINFFLDNNHYKTLNIFLYVFSLIIVSLIYVLSGIFFSKLINMLITSIVSCLIGFYIVLNRHNLNKKISSLICNYNREKYKKKSKENLETTLKRITPKRNLKLNIKNKTSLKQKAQNLKSKFKKVNKTKKEYIEVK